ncbi:MAG: 1-acyl-sn-glycerol-3-phosphate acyltransferase [Clostridia bacterium]|nr:1-acyl-sn-glycerol-3-phosphate acyltransferase [Clostridia bacterium]
MKITKKDLSYEKVCAIPRPKHKKPMRPSRFLHGLIRILSMPDLWATHFSVNRIGMEKLGKNEPCLILMNHSCFLDLKIASACLFPRRFHIVCTSDGFVGFGMELLMRLIGCIPTTKFVTDLNLVRDMQYAVKEQNAAILMYPEASYSFDGTATDLPDSLGGLVKMLGVPVIMIRTYGAFARTPLYNGLRTRRVRVSADMEYLFSPADTKEKTADELMDILREKFSFDNFAWQRDKNVRIDHPERAEGLSRVLYKCPNCMTEGQMTAGGITLTCGACGKSYTLLENGQMQATGGETEYPHIPDWYRWERRCVREELLAGTYKLDISVEIRMLVDTRAIYRVGNGRLTHSESGFHLTGCPDEAGVPRLDYTQKPLASYSLYSDYYWYEIGDMICIGDTKTLYYCFPQNTGDVVAKTRLAAEELYKIVRERKAAAKARSAQEQNAPAQKI